MQSFVKWCCAVSLLIIFGGCAQNQKNLKPVKQIFPESKIMQKPHPKAPGSLYTGYDNLFSDMKAYNVGDVVTITINENISGNGQSDIKTSKSDTTQLNLPSLKIKGRSVFGPNNLASIEHGSNNAYQGKGATTRSAKLVAKITARVVKVYPNGNMYIVGTKYIKINEDTQYLKIAGIVNPKDIEPDNTIDSSKISDMYVEYNGKGFVTDSQQPGWLAKFVHKIWPF